MKKLKNTILFCLFAILFWQNFALAQNVQDAINQQDWITRQQQNILENEKREREFDTIKKERERLKKDDEKPAQKLIEGNMPNCVIIKKIELLEAKSLSKFRRRKIVAPFIGKCMEAQVLENIIKIVGDYYQSKGFVTTQIKVLAQNLQSGVFQLQIIEGKIEKISLGKDGFRQDMQKFMAFGDAAGDTLNINDINQGMYQINRLQSNAAVMKIEPGTNDGESLVKIENNKKFPAHITIGKDNLGNKFTGVQRSNFSSSFDNLLSLDDNISVNYTTNLHDDSQVKELRYFGAGISVPFKYNTLSYNFSRSEFKGQNAGVSGPLVFSGFSQSSKIGLDRVLFNQNNLRFSINSSLTEKSAASYLNGDKNPNSERRLSIANFGFALSSYFDNTTSLYLNPSYSKGLKVLNAMQDLKNLQNTTPKAQFDVFKLYANFSKKFVLPKINAPINFVSEFSGQYAKQTLFGSEQFSVGGYYSVRGFRENYINGDSGYYFRNKFNVNAGSFLAPLLAQNQGFFGKNAHHLYKFSFEPFYDYGHIKNKYTDYGASGRLSGAGLKGIFNSQYFSASLTYSWMVNNSQLITSESKENKMVYFELSASCC